MPRRRTDKAKGNRATQGRNAVCLGVTLPRQEREGRLDQSDEP
jgi:hypothetical protein